MALLNLTSVSIQISMMRNIKIYPNNGHQWFLRSVARYNLDGWAVYGIIQASFQTHNSV